jgi:hypothetical protein
MQMLGETEIVCYSLSYHRIGVKACQMADAGEKRDEMAVA